MVSTPLKKMSSSIGMMIPNINGKIKKGPNHQPGNNGSNHYRFHPRSWEMGHLWWHLWMVINPYNYAIRCGEQFWKIWSYGYPYSQQIYSLFLMGSNLELLRVSQPNDRLQLNPNACMLPLECWVNLHLRYCKTTWSSSYSIIRISLQCRPVSSNMAS